MEAQPKRARTEATMAFNYSSGENDHDDVPEDVVTLHCKPPLERIPPQLCFPRVHLKEVTLPEGLKNIGKKAFEGCTALENLSMPLSLEEIEEDAFKDCTALSEVGLSEGIRCIGSGAFFQCSSLSKLKIPSNMKKIEEGTFCGCSSLVDIDFGNGLKIIGVDAFGKCSSLLQISVSSSIEVLEDGVFWECKRLQHVQLFEGLKRLGNAVFQECSSLEEIFIPSTVESLGESVFSDCTSLGKVELKVGLLKVLGGNSFAGCTALSGSFKVPSTVEILSTGTFHGCLNLEEVILQDGLKKIEQFAFCGCKGVKNFEVPSTVETIEEKAFFQCEALRNVHIRDGLTKLIHPFQFCDNIEKVRLPSTLTVIGQSTFFGKVHLLEISLPMGLKAIKAGGLGNCYSLKRLLVPSSVEEIAYQAFSGCVNMVTVEFPRNMVATIGPDVFHRCAALVNISIPSGMTECENSTDLVDANCFGLDCTRLVEHFGGDNLAKATTHRYDGYLVHEACYHSSTTTEDDLNEQIEASGWHEKEGQLDLRKELLVDSFGMTPLHILVSSAKLRHDLLDVLLNVIPPCVLWWADDSGKRATDYLDWSCGTEDSSKSLFAEKILYKLMVDRLSDWGQDDWKSKMKAVVDEIVSDSSPKSKDDMIYNAYKTLGEFELMESTSLLELFVWKTALNASGAISSRADRSTCRALCGSDIIIPNVITFLKDGDLPERY